MAVMKTTRMPMRWNVLWFKSPSLSQSSFHDETLRETHLVLADSEYRTEQDEEDQTL